MNPRWITLFALIVAPCLAGESSLSQLEAERSRIELYRVIAREYLNAHEGRWSGKDHAATLYFLNLSHEVERAARLAVALDALPTDANDAQRDFATQLPILKERLDFIGRRIALWKGYEAGKYPFAAEGQCEIDGERLALGSPQLPGLGEISHLLRRELKVTPPSAAKEPEFTLDTEVLRKATGKSPLLSTNSAQTESTTERDVKNIKDKSPKLKALEKKQLLEKVRKEFAIEIPKSPANPKSEALPPLTPEEERLVQGKSLRPKSKLIVEAQKSLERLKQQRDPEIDYGDFFLETEVFEKKIKEKRTISDKEFKQLYARYLNSRSTYEKLYEKTPGSARVRILTVAKAINRDLVVKYGGAGSHLIDAIENGEVNCKSGSKYEFAMLMSKVIRDLGVKLANEDLAIGVQLFDGHEQAVLLDRKTKQVTTLFTNRPVAGLVAPIYRPELYLHRMLEIETGRSPLKLDDLLIEDVAPKDRVALQELAKKHKGEPYARTNSMVEFGSNGYFYPRPSTDRARQVWVEGAEPISVEDFIQRADAFSRDFTNTKYVDRTEEAWSLLSGRLSSVLGSSEFGELLALRRDPTLLRSESVTIERITRLKAKEAELYQIFEAVAQATIPSVSEGPEIDQFFAAMSKRLNHSHPRLRMHYEIQRHESERAARLLSSGEGAIEARKGFNLFKVLGVEGWRKYEFLQKGDARAENVGLFLGVPFVAMVSGHELSEYFAQGQNVEYLGRYRLNRSGEPVPSQGTPGNTGFGVDPQGMRQKPEQKASLALDPIDFAEFIRAQSHVIGVVKRWTPGLTAALRQSNDFNPEFVEWFTSRGYREISETRPLETRVISGPDGQAIPKDLAVLLIDFLAGNDAIRAQKGELKQAIATHYGSVEKYIEQVEADFKSK